MNLRRSLAGTATAVAVLGATVLPASAAPTSWGAAGPTASHPKIVWKDCPNYSDEVLKWMGIPDLAKWRQIYARMECGTVQVPLDYRKPTGRKITVALTRLPATDQKHRLGSMALNPGGPGGSGYLMPTELTFGKAPLAKLNERYDLIGFDPRGVGYSSTVDCRRPDEEPPKSSSAQTGWGSQDSAGWLRQALTGTGNPGRSTAQGLTPQGATKAAGTEPITKEQAKEMYDRDVQANKDCAATDPEFLGQITTGNVARDLDQIRRGLGERKLNYLGVSWGSWLGPVYRSLFPGKAGRMWVDSVAPTDPRMDEFEAARTMATYRDFKRFATWLARFDSTYHLGKTQAEVIATIDAIRKDFDANPRKFDDIDMPIDGIIIAISGAQPSPVWPLAGKVLADLRTATGPHAPDSLKDAIGGGPEGPPPAGAPEFGNMTAGQAVFCNGDGGKRDFESAWAAYSKSLADYPVTGTLSRPGAPCAGWPLPVEKIRLHHSGSSLVLSGHRWESVSVFEWTAEMQKAVGGKAFTVEDDVHGSAFMEPDCAGFIVKYFATGRAGADGCQGVPVPDSPDLPKRS